jgi:hypothetical protein
VLETSAVTSGRVLDNKTVMELPVMGNSAITLVRLTPGIQTGGVNNYHRAALERGRIGLPGGRQRRREFRGRWTGRAEPGSGAAHGLSSVH